MKRKGYFYSDDWDAYNSVFPKERHQYSKMKQQTNHLERLNNTIRQRVSRLVRKTLSFSKILQNHIGAIKNTFSVIIILNNNENGINMNLRKKVFIYNTTVYPILYLIGVNFIIISKILYHTNKRYETINI